MQQESPRKCKICGGPNHYGCGCEAQQKQAAVQVETENIKLDIITQIDPPAEQPASEDEIVEKAFSPEAIMESDKVNRQIAEGIRTMNDGIETLCVAMFDNNNYLKLITGDLITIRKHLTKEDEVKDAPENKN